MMMPFAPAELRPVLSEPLLRRALLVTALAGLGVGLVLWQLDHGDARPRFIWMIATLPVIVGLSLSIIRDFWIGRLGVDAIALVSMTAALALGETLAAIVVAIMYAGGTVLEDFARGRAERSLTALTDRSPRTAHRKNDEGLETVAAEQVAVGDELLVQAGELVPVDGTLINPVALLDESMVTGEPLPERRRTGELLRSGTVNAGEAFAMHASATAERSTYAAIVQLVAAAQTAKSPFIRMADRYAIFMLPVTLVVAGLAWYLSGEPIRALAVLVAATPCPLILAAPVAFIGGISRAARHGVVMKGSAALEALASVRTAIFDKTGTLTLGGVELIDLDIAPGRGADQILRLLASLEQASHHVLGDSVLRLARDSGCVLSHPADVREYRGSGLQGVVDGNRVRAGSRALVLERERLPSWAEPNETRYCNQPVLRIFVAVEGRLAAIFTFGDSIRGEARDVLRSLRSEGVSRFVMLTGDDAPAARRVADALGIENVIADADPAEKVAGVSAEKERAPTMMVGDGINDAAALAAATVGVALGARGATASSAAADVIVLANRLQPVADAVRIAQRTRTIALQSILAGLALSGGAMMAGAFGLITPVAGALIQELIDIAVILNALRALGGESG
jgi:heavy metal translocating P-type ATPase